MIPITDNLIVMPLRTPTLPPATHTNCYVAGHTRMTAFDPASPWPDEQDRIADLVDGRLERIVLTHHHHDHIGGVQALQQAVGPVPVWAHPATAELLRGCIDIDHLLREGDILNCEGTDYEVLHTPGHAPGHLVFFDRGTKVLIAGDMVAGTGTIVIGPDDGHLGQYLASLQRIRDLGASALLPAHGDAIRQPTALLDTYIAHRHARTEQFRQVLIRTGDATPLEIATAVYADEVPPEVLPLAAQQVISHLRWMVEHGLAMGPDDADRWRVA